MKSKPNIDNFLAGGAAAAAEVPPAASHDDAPGQDGGRITKTIRLSRMLDRRLKEEAHKRSMTGNGRVTESDLIEFALFKYLGI